MAIFTAVINEVDEHARRAAREEVEDLLAEKAATALKANDGEKLLSVKQAAEIFGVQPQTVYEWIKAEKVIAIRTGKGNRTLRIKKSNVNDALQEQIQPNGLRKYARRSRINYTTSKAKGGTALC